MAGRQCLGQILPISQYSALFSIIGTYHGGNGTSNFALPNLQARFGDRRRSSAGPFALCGRRDHGNTDGHHRQLDNAPPQPWLHGDVGRRECGDSRGNQLGVAHVGGGDKGGTGYTAQIYSPNAAQATTGLAPQAISMTGGSQPRNNMQPYLALNYCIALNRVFPPRN